MDSKNVPLPARTTTRRLARGQAMVEYSVINVLLVVGLLMGATVRIDWNNGDVRRNIIELFLRSLQVYQDSIYYLLNLPFP